MSINLKSESFKAAWTSFNNGLSEKLANSGHAFKASNIASIAIVEYSPGDYSITGRFMAPSGTNRDFLNRLMVPTGPNTAAIQQPGKALIFAIVNALPFQVFGYHDNDKKVCKKADLEWPSEAGKVPDFLSMFNLKTLNKEAAIKAKETKEAKQEAKQEARAKLQETDIPVSKMRKADLLKVMEVTYTDPPMDMSGPAKSSVKGLKKLINDVIKDGTLDINAAYNSKGWKAHIKDRS